MNVDVQAIAGKLTGHAPEDFVKQEEFQRAKALDYLKAKFPDEDEKVFHTDYIGQTYDDVISFWAIAQAAELDGICESCDGTCRISEGLKSSRPVISVSESPKGFRYLEVRWTCGLSCKYQPLTGAHL